MSYKLISLMSSSSQEENQWLGRSIEGELAAFDGRTIVKAFNKYLVSSHMKVLEAGCGIGAWCEWLRRKGYCVVGLEYDEDVVRRAKISQPDIPVELGNITAIKYDANSFDVYVSLGVLEHFELGPERALKEAVRVLKPGGLAIITVPLLTSMRGIVTHPIRNLIVKMMKLRGKTTYFWEYRYTRHEIRSYIENAGFEIIEETVDDYEKYVTSRHIGIWADWFIFRKKSGNVWELNTVGKLLLRALKMLPSSWYCSGWLIVARINK